MIEAGFCFAREGGVRTQCAAGRRLRLPLLHGDRRHADRLLRDRHGLRIRQRRRADPLRALASSSPGCSDASCCVSVCAFDPFCCNSAWDSICANEARTTCYRLGDLNYDGDGQTNAADERGRLGDAAFELGLMCM